jgi:hypothetical protein
MARWTELALKVATAKRLGGTPEGETAMKELSPFVTQTARRIHAQLGSLRRQAAMDFVAIAPALAWKKMEKFEAWYLRELSPEVREQAASEGSAKDWFGAWCFVELRYRYLDAGREQADDQRVRSLHPAAPVVGRPSDAVAEAALDFDLGPEEIERVQQWDPLDGVILFCLTNQWDKVPADLWKQWITGLGLAEPFPPEQYVRAPKTKKRAVLAAALNVSRDVIYQRWLRLKNRFQIAGSVESQQTV